MTLWTLDLLEVSLSDVSPLEIRPSRRLTFGMLDLRDVLPLDVRPSDVRPSDVRPSEIGFSDVLPSDVTPYF